MAHHAGVAELADALDLGSSGNPVEVQILSPAPYVEQINLGIKPRYCFIIFVFYRL